MALIDIINEKLDRLESIPGALATSTEAAQIEIFRELIRLLDQLELDGGNLVLSEANLALVEVIAVQLSEFIFAGDYRTALVEFAGQYNIQGDINNRYFMEIFGTAFIQKDVFGSVILSSQRRAVELLGRAGVDQAFIVPLKQSLNNSITTGESFGETVRLLKDFVEGTKEVDGVMTRHVKQISRDAFTLADRNYTNTIAEDIGLQWYQYSRGTVQDTRDFCLKRQGKFWHKKEVEAWGNIQQWQGRARGTDTSTIFSWLGGHNCLHAILPTSEEAVPEDVIQRNIANGNFKR